MEYTYIHNHQSQFIEMFDSVESFSALENIVSDTFPGEWGNEPTSSHAIKVIRTTNFTNEGRLDLSDVVTREIDSKKVSRKKLNKGDTILERSGGTKDNPVGRVVFFNEDGDYLFNNFTQVLRPKENVNPVYLFYSLYNSYNLNKAAMRAMASQTTGIQNLSMSDYMAKQIKLPSKKLQDKFESIYRQADKSKFDGFKSQFLEMTSKCQSSVKLSSIATYSIGLTYAPEDVNSDGIIVLRSGNIQDGSITLEDIVRVNKPIKDSLYVKKGNILMCSRNGSASLVGKTAIVGDYPERLTFGAFMTLIKTDIPEYINAFFSTPSFRYQVSMGKSSTMNQITQKMLDSIELPLVSVSEQEQFAEIVRQADKSKFELKRAIEAVDKVIKSLING